MPNGFVYAYALNTTPSLDTVGEIQDALIAIGNSQQNWPAHDLFLQYYPEP